MLRGTRRIWTPLLEARRHVVATAPPPSRPRPLHSAASTRAPQPLVQPTSFNIGHQNNLDIRDDAGEADQGETPPGKGDGGKKGGGGGGSAWMPGVESALATGAGILLLALAGLGYHKWYKWEALRKMRRAFAKGYDPVLELARASSHTEEGELKAGRVFRKEQEYINKVINGEITGEYVLLMGPKGVGKTSMIIDAMVANEADGCAMLEAHEDPEVVRLRLGKALDYEYNEDSFAGLFQRKDPREAGPRLDIERALAKLEKAALQFRRERKRPMVLIINNVHFIHDDDDGHSLLHMLQQRAEAWAQAGIVTMIFNSDDFHVYRHLKKNASRMHVLSIRDLTPAETHTFLKSTYADHYPNAPPITRAESLKIWEAIGGRMSYLGRLAKHADMQKAADDMISEEVEWLHHRLGLIPEMDDDVMDEQKYSSCSFLLFQAFARLADESEKKKTEAGDADAALMVEEPRTPEELEALLEDDLVNVLTEDMDPRVTYREARTIMTRADFLLDLDHHNIINVDLHHNVRPDSRLMLNVFRRICSESDFQEQLDATRDRVDAIESLHRTSELTVKKGDSDLGGVLRLQVGHKALAVPDEDDEEGSGSPGDDDGAQRLV